MVSIYSALLCSTLRLYSQVSICGEAHEFIYGRALVAAEHPAKKDAAYNVKQFVLVKSFLVVSWLVLSRGKVRYLFCSMCHRMHVKGQFCKGSTNALTKVYSMNLLARGIIHR